VTAAPRASHRPAGAAPQGDVAGALAAAAAGLDRAGVAAARREARLLLGAALGLGPEAIIAHPERPLSAAEADRFATLVQRRSRREPLSRILGRREFWGLEFRVTADTLDPRPDSETVVQAALDAVTDRQGPLTVLDLGTGTGCLLLALLSELPRARGLGIDASAAAVETACDNATALGLAGRAAFAVGDWGRGVAGPFNLIVTNPPYVATGEVERLAPEVVRYEPRSALDGGADGMDRYRALAPDLTRLLAAMGRAVVEIGDGQADAVAAILAAAGLREVERRADLAGIVRCLTVARGRQNNSWNAERSRLGWS